MKKTVILTILFICRASAHSIGAMAADNENVYVIPSGMSVGIRLYTDGLNVVGTQEIKGRDGREHNAAEENGIKKGDVIFSANGTPLNTVEELSAAINAGSDKVTLEIQREGKALTIDASPVQAEDSFYKLGLWVRDSTAGIGTVTYYMSDNNSYAALGHGICDSDTGNILSVKSGNIQQCSLLSVTKSSRGNPGELEGSFDGPNIGWLDVNSTAGVYGEVSDSSFFCAKPVKAASRYDVREGSAYIMSDAAGHGVEYYSIELQKVRPDSTDTKGIVFKITDERLMDECGGIVRGMSGAPIIQNGEFVGAVTHVFINDPSKGYGIIGENMINNSIKHIP